MIGNQPQRRSLSRARICLDLQVAPAKNRVYDSVLFVGRLKRMGHGM
jgi:hypothetical protein